MSHQTTPVRNTSPPVRWGEHLITGCGEFLAPFPAWQERIIWPSRGTAPPESLVQGYMLGLGGGDIRPEHIVSLLDDLCAKSAAGEPEIVEVTV